MTLNLNGGLFFIIELQAMENKLKKDELVRIVGQLQMIEKLPRGVLQQLARVFKVSDPSAALGQLIAQFRAKVVDIFLQEADGFMDYLQLPRFRALGPQATQKMYSVFRTAWNDYRQFKLKQQASQTRRQIQDLTPSFDTHQKMERFHLDLLQLYRDSSVCPRNIKSNVKISNQPKNSPPQITNFLYPNQNQPSQTINNGIPAQLSHSLFPIFPFSQTPNYPKIEPQDGNPYIIDNKAHVNNTPHGSIFDMARFGMQPHPSFFTNHQQLYQPVPRVQQMRKTDQTPQKNIFTETLTASLGYFARYEFIQCVCAGEAGLEGRDSFKCTLCSFSYHLQCMKIEKSPSIGAICPLCILRRETVFCKVNLEPMKFKWHFNERGRQLKVEMTQQQSHEIYQARRIGLDCQIRFLKIDGKSLRRQNRAFDGFSSCNGYLQKTAKHTEITLPELSQDRNQPISLEIVLRSQDDADNFAPKLYLFAVFLITNKKVDEIINDLFNSQDFTTEQFYKGHYKDEGKIVISLQGENFVRGQIKYPVRGDSCTHLEVFDLKPYLQLVSDLKKENDTQINCPVCSNSCSFFKFDRFIYNAIQNFNQYDQTAPEGICIMPNGEYLWVGQNLQEQEDNAMQNQDEPMDEEPSHQEEQQPHA